MSGFSVMQMGLIGLTTSWLLIPLIQRFRASADRRQLHHTHQAPISRFGGLAVAVAFVIMAAVAFVFYPVNPEQTHERWVIVVSSLAVFLIGFWDDIRPLGAKRKLLGQILIASAVYLGGIHIGTIKNPMTGVTYVLGASSYFATVLWLISFINLINLIDGIDGLAGGICLMAMGLLLYVGWHSDSAFPMICAAGMCGALLGFLRYNFPPAKIYLGDGGAYFLGFLIGILSMVHSQKGTIAAALIAPLFALALPIADVALAIVRRAIHGLPIFRPDRQHLHHRLAKVGLSRTRIVLMFYGCSLFFLLLAFGVFASQGKWVPFLFGVACLALLVSAGSFSFSREWFAVGRVLGNSLELRKEIKYALTMGRWLELEAERSKSAEDLWADFGFFSRKLGFSAVTLSTPEGRKHWNWVTTAHRGKGARCHRKRQDLPGGSGSALEFTGPEHALELKTFELLSELAAETWLKSTQRWQQAHKLPFSFRVVPTPLPEPPFLPVRPPLASAQRD
jgi:UDP-GlcNAc:undecaprenyl-phosphate/decaprenyl-phosphate GlcNAc-1-phosphate transferase